MSSIIDVPISLTFHQVGRLGLYFVNFILKVKILILYDWHFTYHGHAGDALHENDQVDGGDQNSQTGTKRVG